MTVWWTYIAVVGEGGSLKARVRMDGTFIGSINVSINKAYYAVAFQIETKDLAPSRSRDRSSSASAALRADG